LAFPRAQRACDAFRAPSLRCSFVMCVERQNLTIRRQMRRLTRLTNAFSKKWENLWAAYCVHFAWYNFVRRHQSLRMTPAMAAGITDHMWTMCEVLEAG
jgi:hypothetical protein